MLGLSPVLIGLLFVGSGEVLCERAQGLLYQHPVTPCLPGVKLLLDPTSDCIGCGDIIVSLQYQHLKYNETLRIPQSVLHPS